MSTGRKKSFEEQKFELLQSTDRVTKAIDEEIDWAIIYLYEKVKIKKEIYYKIYEQKVKNLAEVARKEMKKYEQINREN